MSKTLKALVLCGEGINCEQETQYALKKVGFSTEVATINELVSAGFNQSVFKNNYSVLALPGGFSYGDELGSGRVLGLKIKRELNLDLHDFAANGGLVIGICNGFQALIRMGTFGKNLTITRNSTNQFVDRWVGLKKISKKPSVWLEGIESLDLPIRHGEGRIVIDVNTSDFDPALSYQEDVNGSQDLLAGLTTAQGRILGLMPHPEAFVQWTQHPTWTQNRGALQTDGAGLRFFLNAYETMRKGN